MALGAALGQLTYQVALKQHHIHVRMQDVRFTAAFAAVAAIAIAAHQFSALGPVLVLVPVALAVVAFGRQQLINEDLPPTPVESLDAASAG
jgi:hypothetical protein